MFTQHRLRLCLDVREGGRAVRHSLHPLQAKQPPLSEGHSCTHTHTHTHMLTARLVLLLEEMVQGRGPAHYQPCPL